MSAKKKIFKFSRTLLRMAGVDRLLPLFTSGKGYNNIFVKCLPQNYQYPKGVFRKVRRHGISYTLDLSEYMEWVIYFDLNVEHRGELYSLVKKGMVILDVGGNIGETAMNFAKLSGPDGLVVSFEPVPETYQKCLANLKLNNFPWLKVEQVALSDKKETLYFDPATYNNSGGIYLRKETVGCSLSVNAICLDEYVEARKIPSVNLIKIDVEGFEYNVLKGAVHTLLTMRPLLYIEINDYNLKRQRSSAKQIFDFLFASGYRIFCEGEELFSPPAKSHYDILAKPEGRSAV